jgi:three-Cys-motif partner protein
MASRPKLKFGGPWTERKLAVLAAYLDSYQLVMSKQSFKTVYVDGFAGTGYRDLEDEDGFFQEFLEEDVEKFLEGSASKSLRIERPFSEYHFIELSRTRASALDGLKSEFIDLQGRIKIHHGDANRVITEICREGAFWRDRRAVVFLDPFALDVDWATIVALSKTRAVDLWYLFPTNAVNRLLTKSGKRDPKWDQKLDKFLGCSEWREEFYKVKKSEGLFAEVEEIRKEANFDAIESFVVERMKSIFPGVGVPGRLHGPTGVVVFSFLFACANPNGKDIALRIANHLVERQDGTLQN